MKEIIFGIMPGAIFFYRYSPKLSAGATSGLILMEIIPFLLIATIESISPLEVATGFFILYSIYELGYIENDIKAKDEEVGATVRDQFKKFNYKIFLLFRIPIILFVLFFAAMGGKQTHQMAIISSLVIIPIFLLHNRLKNGIFRVSTFLALNNLKIIARILALSPLLSYYFMASIPHIIIKTMHYINAKKVAQIDAGVIKELTLPIYGGFLFSFLFIDPWLIVVTSPYLLNHTKSIFFASLNGISKVR